jgi:hypothetical protein
VWTGKEVALIASTTSSDIRSRAALYLYDPERDRWRAEPIPTSESYLEGITATWTGKEIVLWGYPYHKPDQAPIELAYDPEDGWRTIAHSPLPFRENSTAAWTGREVIVFGGDDDVIDARPGGGDGAAYDPGTDSWRPLPESPLPELRQPQAVWTGSEVLIWGGDSGGSHPTIGGRYDPVADRWASMADASIPGRVGAVLGWTGSDLVVAGGKITYGPEAEFPPSGIYDPDTDSWAVAAAPPSPCSDGAVAWTGEEMIVWGGSARCDALGDELNVGYAWRPSIRAGE